MDYTSLKDGTIIQSLSLGVLRFVAVKGTVNDYAVYWNGQDHYPNICVMNWPDDHIAKHGKKLAESHADILFGGFPGLEYRH